MVVSTAQQAAEFLRERGVVGVLVGTAALKMYGYAVEAPDLDFLVDGPIPLLALGVVENVADADGTYAYPDVLFDGMKAQFIATRDRGHGEFFHPERAVEINGVLVAAVKDVIGLKRWRGRDKDREFLRGWDAWANREVK